jgi:hypothetical protein
MTARSMTVGEMADSGAAPPWLDASIPRPRVAIAIVLILLLSDLP